MPIEKGPVGVFDSGVGGLTVVKEIQRLLPGQDILYFGDTARLPYGNKSPETIVRYSMEIGRFLTGKGIRVLVVACNTSSSTALNTLSCEMTVPVLGMIEPGARAALKRTKNRRIGLIGTRATVASGAYEKQIKALQPEAEVFSVACPLFVPLVEEGWASDPIACEVAGRYLRPLLQEGVDTIILGCTHYPVLIPVIQEIVGSEVGLVSSAETAALALRELLLPGGGEAGDQIPGSLRGTLRVYVTDSGTHFQSIGEYILGIPITKLAKIDEERLVFNEK